MAKALIVKSVGEVILVAIVVLVSVVILLGPGMDWVKKVLGYFKLIPSPPSEFENAIKCSYYRCTKGCDAPEIKGLKVGEKYCDKGWCKDIPDEFKTDNKVCGWDAMQYPVETIITEKEYDKSIGGINFNCILSLDSPDLGLDWGKIGEYAAGTTLGVTACLAPIMGVVTAEVALITCPVFVAWVWFEQQWYVNNLLLDPEIITSPVTTEECKVGEKSTDKAIKTFNLVSGKNIYVSSSHKPEFLQTIDVTLVVTKPTYLILPQNEMIPRVQMLKNEWHRIKVENIGDIFVKPETTIVYSEEEEYGTEVFSKLLVKFSSQFNCPEKTEVNEISKDDCKQGQSICDGKFFVRCVSIENVDNMIFSVSYGVLPPPPSIELFEDVNFGGRSISLTNDDEDLTYLPFGISSIKLSEGYKAILYEEKSYKGKNITITGNSSYLVHCKDNWWDFGCPAYVSSIKFDKPGCSATVYSDEEYRGEEMFVNEDKKYLDRIPGPCRPNPWAAGNWNDCIKSIKVKEGCKAILYEHVNFEGRNVTVSGNSSTILFDDKTKSIKIIKEPQKFYCCRSTYIKVWWWDRICSSPVSEYDAPKYCDVSLSCENQCKNYQFKYSKIIDKDYVQGYCYCSDEPVT